MTRAEASKLVAIAIAATAQGGRMTVDQVEDMRDAWAMLLADLSYEHAGAALATVLQTSPYLPAVSDVRKVAVELAHGPGRTGAEAWGDVHAAMARYGSWRAPGVDFEFGDPLVADIVRSFGWRELCASDATGSKSDRARFIEAYEQRVQQGKREAQAPALGAARQLHILAAGVAKKLQAPPMPRALPEGVIDMEARRTRRPPDDEDEPPWEDE